MTHIVHVHADPEHGKYKTRLNEVARNTLTIAHAPSGELSIALVDQQQIIDLNREFRHRDIPTDVLAFQADVQDPETGLTYLGDVIIAVPIAETQATSAGHSLEAELSFLTIHGLLHLLGFDHSNDDEKSKMWEMQAKIVEQMDLRINEPS